MKQLSLIRILFLISVALFFLQVEHVQAQNFRIHFNNAESVIDPTVLDNKNVLEQIKTLGANNRILSVTIDGYTSTDGSVGFNDTLALNRVNAFAKWMTDNLKITNDLMGKYPHGIAWSILREDVSNSDFHAKSKVLDIIDNTPIWVVKNGKIVTGRKKELMDLNGGKIYEQLRERFFPNMRNVTIVVEIEPIEKEEPVQEVVVSQVEDVQEEEIVELNPIIEQEAELVDVIEDAIVEKKHKLDYALKTNLLYDLVVVPNIGIEIPISESRWSINANWMYTWIINKDHTFCWRGYGGDLEVRKYFGGRSWDYLYEGHHLGLYGQGLTYDVALNKDKGYQSMFSYSAGLVYGYSHQIGKKLKMDYSIGAGYFTGDYEQYIPIKGKAYWTESHTKNYFGITRLEVSLKWVIGRLERVKTDL